jgi:transcriptional regulator with XRE-family HTH domain
MRKKNIDPAVLKRLRNAKGWSQEDLATKTKFPGFPKIDKQTISRLERGEQSKPAIARPNNWHVHWKSSRLF